MKKLMIILTVINTLAISWIWFNQSRVVVEITEIVTDNVRAETVLIVDETVKDFTFNIKKELLIELGPDMQSRIDATVEKSVSAWKKSLETAGTVKDKGVDIFNKLKNKLDQE